MTIKADHYKIFSHWRLKQVYTKPNNKITNGTKHEKKTAASPETSVNTKNLLLTSWSRRSLQCGCVQIDLQLTYLDSFLPVKSM